MTQSREEDMEVELRSSWMPELKISLEDDDHTP